MADDGNPILVITPNYPPTTEALDRLTNDAFEFVKKNYNKDADGNSVKGGRVTIVGFSYGGVLALHLSRRLDKAGIPVEVLRLQKNVISNPKFCANQLVR